MAPKKEKAEKPAKGDAGRPSHFNRGARDEMNAALTRL